MCGSFVRHELSKRPRSQKSIRRYCCCRPRLIEGKMSDDEVETEDLASNADLSMADILGVLNKPEKQVPVPRVAATCCLVPICDCIMIAWENLARIYRVTEQGASGLQVSCGVQVSVYRCGWAVSVRLRPKWRPRRLCPNAQLILC